jgi:diketogulonate reductase-like aldo/keto reductase
MVFSFQLWNIHHNPLIVVPVLQRQLRTLGLDYVDLYLMHWPHAYAVRNSLFYPNNVVEFRVWNSSDKPMSYLQRFCFWSRQDTGVLRPMRPDGKKYFFADFDYVDTYKAMEDCVRLGLTRGIGLSNFNSVQVQRVLDNCGIKPVVNQVPLNFSSIRIFSVVALLVTEKRDRLQIIHAYFHLNVVHFSIFH